MFSLFLPNKVHFEAKIDLFTADPTMCRNSNFEKKNAHKNLKKEPYKKGRILQRNCRKSADTLIL